VALALLPGTPAAARDGHEGLQRWRGPVEHLFVHPLLPSPKYTLHRGTQPQEFAKWNITAREFRRILPQLHANGYVLVDLPGLVRPGGKGLRRAPLWLPPGKKPLVISVDDLNYPQYMVANHLNSRLVLQDGRVAAQRITPAGATVVSRTSEVVPLLDDFVAAHPDFSHNGAKGTIALTGAEGILGYRTSGTGRQARRERTAAAPVVDALRATGWSFASHSYAHIDVARASLTQVTADTRRWERQVEPLLGHNVRVFVYPYGAYPQPGSAAFAALRGAGFDIFCGITPGTRFEIHGDHAVQDRVRVDGLALTTQQRMLRRFFRADQVLDPARG
jgi:peptidoglycan/xylan/chitin deacetylase (PgdA/CDA1 family)